MNRKHPQTIAHYLRLARLARGLGMQATARAAYAEARRLGWKGNE